MKWYELGEIKYKMSLRWRKPDCRVRNAVECTPTGKQATLPRTLPNLLLAETLRVACFHVRASVFVGAASPSGEGEVVRVLQRSTQ